MAADLEAGALDVISEVIYDMKTLDINALRDAVTDHVAETAPNYCSYYSECMDVISRYEGHSACAYDLSEYLANRTFKADEWQDAMQSYANAVAYCVLSALTSELVQKVEEAVSELDSAAEAHGYEGDTDEPVVTTECPHGWAVHDAEDAAGHYYWTERNLEGCRAVAIRVAGIWLSHTWTPETEDYGSEP